MSFSAALVLFSMRRLWPNHYDVPFLQYYTHTQSDFSSPQGLTLMRSIQQRETPQHSTIIWLKSLQFGKMQQQHNHNFPCINSVWVALLQKIKKKEIFKKECKNCVHILIVCEATPFYLLPRRIIKRGEELLFTILDISISVGSNGSFTTNLMLSCSTFHNFFSAYNVIHIIMHTFL